MSDVFISYARKTETYAAEKVADALRALGFSVWYDADLPAHREFSLVIEENLREAKAVIVIWSAAAAKSSYVRAEANTAREAGKLVQLRVDETELPLAFRENQCVDLAGWSGGANAPGWRKVTASVEELVGRTSLHDSKEHIARPPATPIGPSICVLPFANMSADADQEYFSDGISEDIITDLSKVTALRVVSRNSAFQYKGRHVDLPKVARELKVSHVLEGSVRKAAGRVRITAQLIDGATNAHIWAERYDRDFSDIFALQDEISAAIVGALKVKLLPEERAEFAKRGTASPEAYNYLLMAHQRYVSGDQGDPLWGEGIIRFSRRATELDPNYARAWAYLGLGESARRWQGFGGEDGLASARQALAIDPTLAEAYVVKARALMFGGRYEEAIQEATIAYRLAPANWFVNYTTGLAYHYGGRGEEALSYFECAASLDQTDINTPVFLLGLYTSKGDLPSAVRAAKLLLDHAEKALEQDRNNAHAVANKGLALAALDQSLPAREWIGRALSIDAGSVIVRLQSAMALAAYLKEPDAAIDVLEPALARITRGPLSDVKGNSFLRSIRDHPRFQEMVAEAEARVAGL